MITRFVLFLLTSGLGTIIDTLVVWVFSTFVFDGYVGDYIISPIIAFEVACLCNFTCSYFFIWNRRIEQKTKKTFVGKYLVYNLSASGTFGVKMVFLLLVAKLTGWNVVICNLVALCFSGAINYAMSEWVIFRDKKSKPVEKNNNI